MNCGLLFYICFHKCKWNFFFIFEKSLGELSHGLTMATTAFGLKERLQRYLQIIMSQTSLPIGPTFVGLLPFTLCQHKKYLYWIKVHELRKNFGWNIYQIKKKYPVNIYNLTFSIRWLILFNFIFLKDGEDDTSGNGYQIRGVNEKRNGNCILWNTKTLINFLLDVFMAIYQLLQFSSWRVRIIRIIRLLRINDICRSRIC